MSGGKIVLLILAILGVLFIVSIAVCGGLLFWGYSSADKVAGPEVDAMFAAIDNGTFVDTYDTRVTPALQAAATRQEYEQLGEVIRTRLGSLQSKSLRSFNWRQHNADSWIEATYAATFEKGQGEIIVKMQRIGEEWKFASFRVNSPVLAGVDLKEQPAEELPVEETPAEAPDLEVEAPAP